MVGRAPSAWLVASCTGVALAALGCASSTPVDSERSAEPPAVSSSAVIEPSPPPTSPPVASASSAGPPPARSVAVPVASPPRDWRAFAKCNTDADCGWDDPCVATLCLAHRDFSDRKCTESAPPPGSCMCVEGACTLKPSKNPAPAGTCETHGCFVDRARGACVADTGGVPENVRPNPHVDTGPSCDCIQPQKGCAFQWFDPIPCKSDFDCWVSHDPRPHPVARPKALKNHKFKPCSDGEIPPVCGADGFCALGFGYSC